MKKLILLAAVCLTGCITIPVTQKFPNMPPELMESCKPLAIIEGETTTLSKLMDTVAKNYGTRHDCAAKWKQLRSGIQNKRRFLTKPTSRYTL